MADGEKLNVDSIIARLLEGWFRFRYSRSVFAATICTVLKNSLLPFSSRFKAREECTTYRGRNSRAVFKITRDFFEPTDPSRTGSSAQNLR